MLLVGWEEMLLLNETNVGYSNGLGFVNSGVRSSIISNSDVRLLWEEMQLREWA